MTAKPHVFKMGGSWIWQCQHETRTFSEDYPISAWRNPWDACIGGAGRHAVQYHVEPAEVIER